MGLYAGPGPSQFGRKLADEMFGEKKTSLLKTQIIGPLKSRRDARTPVSEEARHASEGFLQPTNNNSFCFSLSCFFSDIWTTPEENFTITLTCLSYLRFVVLNFSYTYPVLVVVKLKYPEMPCFAHKGARKKANQMGLDFKHNSNEPTLLPENGMF